MTETLFVSSGDVSDLATAAEYVDAVREGYRQRGEGAPAQPRSKFFREEPPGMLTSYAAVLPDTGAMGGYMYSSGFGAEDAWFMTPIFDAESGEPLSLLDGASMNPYKTGATGAVGVDALARADSETLAVIGSGSQARGQLRATATVRDFSSVRVYSPTPANREAFAAEFDDRLAAAVDAVGSSAEAIDGADVVITATRASEPVFDGDDLDPGTHVTAMGQYSPDKRERDARTIERSLYVPDLRERATFDAGSFMLAVEEGVVTEADIHAELGDVVANTAPGRTEDDQITVFDSGGTGIETVAAGYLLYERALEAGLGTTIDFAPATEAMSED